MSAIQSSWHENRSLAAAGVSLVIAFLFWIFNGLVNILNFLYWAMKDGDSVPMMWGNLFFARLSNPMEGWDHNSLSKAFPWLMMGFAIFTPFLLGKLRTWIVGMIAIVGCVIFWLIHDPSSLNERYSPYYASIGLRSVALIAFALLLGTFARRLLGMETFGEVTHEK